MLRTVACAAGLLALAAPAFAEPQKFPATLTRHAQLPGPSFVPAPEGAPAYFNVSGRYSAGARQDALYANPVPATGLAQPFPAQPLQGFSGIRSLGDDRFLVLTDNGFGTKANSADVVLMFNILRVDWQAGRVAIEKTIRLSDPHARVPFPIIAETSTARHLTGADFDLESIQPVGSGYWIGDEFGPWLIEVDGDGVVLQVIATEPGGELIRSPDNAFVQVPDPGGALPEEVKSFRSGGYEGMALDADGTTLYPLLEKPLFVDGGKQHVSGRPVLAMFEFDAKAAAWSDRVRYYPLEDAAHAIGDFNIIEGSRALIIERDGNQGDPRQGWAEKPAAFKRIYLVDLERADENGVLEKIAYIDLMDIRDPEGVAPRGTMDGVFTFPFVTIEDVDRIDETHIVVANDNNYPYSTGREQGRADDNEMIVLEVGEFLRAQ